MKSKNSRWWDIWAVLLLLFAIWTAALRLELTNWTTSLNRVEFLSTIGLILGILLGLSTFDKRVVRWMMVAYSMFFVPWQLAATIEDVPSWSLRILNVLQRSLESLNLFFLNQPATDTTLFLLIMCALFWSLGLSSGYLLTRYAKPWVPLFLMGLTLFVIDFNDPVLVSRYRFSGLFVLFALLLAGRIYYIRSQRSWAEKGVAIEFETGFSFTRSMLISGFLLVFSAWNLPVVFQALSPGTPANQAFTERWNQLRDRTSNAFAGLESSVVYIYDFYQDSMALGTGIGLGDQTLFTVKPSARPQYYQFYWRGYSYDFYDGAEWSNTATGRGEIQPDDWPLAYPDYLSRRQVDVEFQLRSVGMRPIYAPAMILSVDRPGRYISEDLGDGYVDLVGVIADPSIRPRSSFIAQSWVAVPTVNQLRDAGTEYPEWTERYLQLPDEFPDSIRQLAMEIIEGETNPYNQVQLITQYLRTEIEYQEVIDPPPADKNVMEWFLFEYKRGFCNYYATAEILMLRSLGIPARIAVGFAQGEYQEEEEYFEIREKDSHAWPEVFFPGIGWVEFEPTSSQPIPERIELTPEQLEQGLSGSPVFPNDRPLMDFELMDERAEQMDTGSASASEVPPAEPASLFWIWFLLAAAVAALAGMIFYKRNPAWFVEPLPIKLERGMSKLGLKTPRILWLWARQMELHPIERMFTQIPWMLKLLGHGTETGTTPQEQVQKLVADLPDAKEYASNLLDQYQLAVYSPHPFDLALARQAYLQLWRQVSYKATRRVMKWLPV
jgi:transglutaminase-like putative cysteine protease